MESTEEEKIQRYIQERVKDQLYWYEKQAIRSKKKSLNLQVMQLTVLFAIPVFLLGADFLQISDRVASLAASGCAVYAALIAAMSSVLKLDTKWEQYRFVAEQLKREMYSYQLGVGEYRDIPESKKGAIFVEKVESIVSGEMSRWFVGERKGGME